MKVLLVGPVKSGTSAVAYKLRERLQESDGAPYELLFEPYKLVGLNVPDNCIVKFVRPHDVAEVKAVIDQYDESILLVRHPFSVLVSLTLFCGNNQPWFGSDEVVQGFVDLLRKKERDPLNTSFRELVAYLKKHAHYDIEAEITQYYDSLRTLSSDDRFRLVTYEQVEKGITLDTHGRQLELSLDVALDEQHKFIAREKSSNAWMRYFVPADVAYYRELFASTVELFGFDTEVPDADSEPRIDPKVFSEYFVRTLNQRRETIGLDAFSEGHPKYGDEGKEMLYAIREFRRHPKKAIKRLESVISEHPDMAEAQYVKAHLKRLAAKKRAVKDQAKHLKQANSALKRAIALRPDYTQAKIARIQVKYGLGDYRQAIKLAKQIESPSPDIAGILRKSAVRIRKQQAT